MKSKKSGELVQINHMNVTKNGVSIKHLQAWDPRSKFIIADANTTTTSVSAAKFLQKPVTEMPFKVTSIQVDGVVERGNRTFKEEFYRQKSNAKSITQVRKELYKSVEKYNKFRPYFSLKGMTLMEYNLKNIRGRLIFPICNELIRYFMYFSMISGKSS